MDWVPTLLASAETAPDPAYPTDGINLLPFLTQNAALIPRTLFWRYKGNAQRAARDGDYQYLNILDNTFLFNVVATPTLTRARSTRGSCVRPAEIVALIDQLLDSHADRDIATILNARGNVSGTGQPFQRRIVKLIRHSHQLRSLHARLRAGGLLTRDEMADRLKVTAATVKIWARHGLVHRHPCNDKQECLYEPQARTRRSKCRTSVTS